MRARSARASWRVAFRSSPAAPTIISSCSRSPSHSITGKDADAALGRANITVNKNAIPNDPRPPSIASGLRIGTPASTTRGFKEREVEQVGDLMAEIIEAGGSAEVIERVRPQVIELCRRFPVYGP